MDTALDAKRVARQCYAPRRPPSICDNCWSFIGNMRFLFPPISPQDGSLYQSWPRTSYSISRSRMKTHAEAGCVWCRLLLVWCQARHLTTAFRRSSSDERYTVTVARTTLEGKDGLSVKMDQSELFRGILYASPDNVAASCISGRRDMTSLGPAKVRIEECVHGHDRCKIAASRAPRLPSRLVDCSDLDRPRLVTTTGEEYGEYLALSYVWGKDAGQTCKATMSNISTLERGLPSALPATIRDAIYVTHTLGFRWLWVDSLCIIQDSEEDTRHEIGRMHHIYRYAHLTIIAGGVEKVGDSFLQGRPAPRPVDFSNPTAGDTITLPFFCFPHPPSTEEPDSHQPAELPLGEVHLVVCDDSKYSAAPALSWSSTGLGRISKRAWCLQESLLSPRALLFTPQGLLFRCLQEKSAQVIETAYVSTSTPCWDDEAQGRIPDVLFSPDPPAASPASDLWYDVHESWRQIIEGYSERMASVQSDKLVACAAIAELFHRVLRSDYLAGLWNDTLLTDLLWRKVPSLSATLTRPNGYRAPSWSWAAMDGRLAYRRLGGPMPNGVAVGNDSPALEGIVTAQLVEICRCEVTLKHAALPFGEVTGGSLVLRGVLLPFRWERLPGRVRSRPHPRLPSLEQARRSRWGLGSSGGEDDSEAQLSGGDHAVRGPSGIDYEDDSGSVVLGELDCADDDEIEQMWAVPLVQIGEHVHGLFLALAAQTVAPDPALPEKHTFRRIGRFDAFIRSCDTSGALWVPIIGAARGGDFPVEIEIV